MSQTWRSSLRLSLSKLRVRVIGARQVVLFLKRQSMFSGVSLVVSLVTLYLTFFWHPERLDVYFRFNDPAQVGTSTFDLSYFFSNDGSRPYLIENVSVDEVWLKSPKPVSWKSGATGNPSICLHTAGFPLQSASLEMPTFLSFKRQHHWSFPSGGSLAVLSPSRIYIDGVESRSASTIVEPRQPKVVLAIFKTEPLDRKKYNIVVECPIIRFFNSTGHPFVAICRGWQSIMMEGASNGYYFLTPPRDSAELAPSPRSCVMQSDF